MKLYTGPLDCCSCPSLFSLLKRSGGEKDYTFPVNREGVVGEVAISGCLGHSNHEVAKFKIFGNRRKPAIKM